MKRYGSVIKVRAEKLDEYVKLHADVWPDVLSMIAKCNIKNYSIYLKQFDDGEHYLFSHFEYHGNNYQADMDKMAADSNTQRWWDVCKPCHEPFANRQEGEWWAEMEEVFFFAGGEKDD